MREKQQDPEKQRNKRKKLIIAVVLIVAWILSGQLITLLFGKAKTEQLSIEIAPARIDFHGLNVSQTLIYSWVAMGIVVIAAILIRIFVIPRMKDKPTGIQNVLELAIEGIAEYTQTKGGNLGDNLSTYIFTIVIFMASSATVELFGFRPPTSDITVTFALAIISFILINYYGIKKKGLLGRIKSMASPTPVIFPMKVISDLAIPLSLACRLFGNMLGGMIVMKLLYFALGNNGLLIPSVLGLFFNIAHPSIQIFIFVTLTLTFINEAAE